MPKACHAKVLWKNEGEPLSEETLSMFIDSLIDDITCVVFMGGDIAPDEVNNLAAFVHLKYPDLKIGWYSGGETITIFTEYRNFDYLKFGPYIKKLGGLNSPKTNQRLYKVEGSTLRDITSRFW